jgi:hypothetical protein
MSRGTRCAGLLSAVCAMVALLALGMASPVQAADQFNRFGLASTSAAVSDTDAGAHADFTTDFELNVDHSASPWTYASLEDVHVQLPPGLVGDPNAVPKCPVKEFVTFSNGGGCPTSSQVGVARFEIEFLGVFYEPIYDLQAPEGMVAKLGVVAAFYPTYINVKVRPGDYSVEASVEGAYASAGVLNVKTTLWGVPADPVHNSERINPEESAFYCSGLPYPCLTPNGEREDSAG